MNSDRQAAHLADMLAFICELRAIVEGLSATDFAANRILCLAVEKLFINLGEAAFRLGDEATKSSPGIPWRQIIGLRNILAHGYEQVAHEVLFNTVIHDLPAVESTLRQLVNPNPSH
jgi:uncharacterized protein with HEPN domain